MQEQSATLQRALSALQSICVITAEESIEGGGRDIGCPRGSTTEQSNPDDSRSAVEGFSLCDPAAWRAPFIEWLDSTCALHPRAFGGVTALHHAYCEWEIARDGVPCNPDTFMRLLGELGFLIGEIEGVLLVSGLTFRDDVEAAEFQPT